MSLRALNWLLTFAVAAAGCERTPEPPPPARRLADIVLAPDTANIEDRVPARATLAGLLQASALRPEIVLAVVEESRRVFDARRLHAGNRYELVRTLDGFLRRFEYEIDLDTFLRVTAPIGQPTAVRAEIVPYEKTRASVTVGGGIDREAPSLFEAMDAIGETPELSIALAGIFGGEIDFHADLQPGDAFRVAVEKVYREGAFVGYGPIEAAEFQNEGRRLRAVRFTVPGGRPDYYDEQGRSVRRFFLRSPLKFEPIVTSRFSRSRFHPVLRIYRPHLGVDYAAPAGAPVVAVADGVVVSAGWAGEGGNQIVLRHPSGYQTYYMHLSRIGVRAGQHVAQGQTIGRVGMTGLATGPHLDYRIRRDGVFVNPLLEHKRLPPGEPIPPKYLAAYQAVRDVALARLNGTGHPGHP
jgi:murein DD-endopeptidase MepM/ murein hydrolase activator NlpD